MSDLTGPPRGGILIGCPIRDRAWIFDPWVDHALEAVRQTTLTSVEFLFVTHPEDDATIGAIIDRFDRPNAPPATVVTSEEKTPVNYVRNWGLSRFGEMASLRNQLLGQVRKAGPDLFWSLDSDILVHPTSLLSALEALRIGGFDAVGQCCFMSSKGTLHPSYGMLPPAGGLRRPYQPGRFSVDVIMAAKVMTPAAYAIDYAPHRQGEDIGWSIAARSAGLRLGWDGTVTSKHVMKPDELDLVDDRCGY